MTEPATTNVIPLPLSADDWPAPPRTAAFTGLAGEIVAAIEPHSESDPLAILAQLLVCFGSAIGRGAHYAVEASEHHGNEFVLLVGPTAKGRKGSAWDHVERIFTSIDPCWASERIVSGLTRRVKLNSSSLEAVCPRSKMSCSAGWATSGLKGTGRQPEPRRTSSRTC